MRLWVGRICGLWSIPMVKLVSGGGLIGHWCGFRCRLQWVMESPAAAKGTVSEVRTGWIKAEEFAEDDLELVLCECWFHILDAVDVGQPRDMVEE